MEVGKLFCLLRHQSKMSAGRLTVNRLNRGSNPSALQISKGYLQSALKQLHFSYLDLS